MRKVTITTAETVSEETYRRLCEGFRQKLGEVAFEHKIDDSLIGGFIADIDGQIYDMSLSAQLTKLKSRLTE